MASVGAYTVEALRLMRNVELKDILRGDGKPTYGTKAELIKRILTHGITTSQVMEKSIRDRQQTLADLRNETQRVISELGILQSSVHVAPLPSQTPIPVDESSPVLYKLSAVDRDYNQEMLSQFESGDGFLSAPPTPIRKVKPIPKPRVKPVNYERPIVHYESYFEQNHSQAMDNTKSMSHSLTKPTPKPRISKQPLTLSPNYSCTYEEEYSQPIRAQECDVVRHCDRRGSLVCVSPRSGNGVVTHDSCNQSAPHTHSCARVCCTGDASVCCQGSRADNSMTNALLESIAQGVQASHFPVVEPNQFSGDIMVYQEWRKQFMNFISRKTDMTADDKLYYLQKYTSGEANGSVRGYCILKSEQAFKDAVESLDSDYGNNFLTAQAFRQKLRSWPKVSHKDPRALKRLSDYLKQCRSAIIDIPQLEILNDCEENQKLLTLLPYHIVTKWNDKVTDYMTDNKDNYPSFSMFVDFLARQAKSANNPISSLQAVSSSQHKDVPTKQVNKEPTKESAPAAAIVYNSVKTEPNLAKCVLCNAKEHKYISQCPLFKAMDYHDRMSTVKEHRLCYICLSSGHVARGCDKQWVCSSCQSPRHHTQLHDLTKTETSVTDKPRDSTCSNTNVESSSRLYARIIPVWLSTDTAPREEFLTYALLDDQSNTTFISDELAANITARSEKASIRLSTMTSKNTAVCSRRYFGLQVRGLHSDRTVTLPPTYSRQHIPYIKSSIPTSKEISKIPHLKHISDMIAPQLDIGVDLLIGRDCIRALAQVELAVAPEGLACATRSLLGWCVVGPSSTDSTQLDPLDPIKVSHATLRQPIPMAVQIENHNDPIVTQDHIAVSMQTEVYEQPSPQDLMRQISDADFQSSPGTKTLSQEDIKFVNILNSDTYVDDEGFYTMPLPFKSDKPSLTNNYEAVVKRFTHLKSKFSREPKFAADYAQFMQGIIDRGEAERVPDSELKKGECWYLPHHGVYHKQKNKIRVVFDCSAQSQGVSLNDSLLQGPDLNNPLLGVLLRFRMESVALSCDIEKMYHRFRVAPQHRDYMRFLWMDGDDTVVYRMRVHIFGARSSPNCAKYGLNKIADDHGSESPAREFIQTDFYVDDGLRSVRSISEAVNLIKQTQSVCNKGNLRVHKILSNKSEVLAAFPVSDTAIEADNVSLCGYPERALGVLWSLGSDSFKFAYQSASVTCTRRNMLSAIAAVYDPIGLLAPLTLTGRILLQDACKSGHNWDECLSEAFSKRWSDWNNNMKSVSELEVPRCVTPPGFQAVRQEIHTFADASSHGYGACSYLRSIDDKQNVHCSLILGKSRVAPVRVTTIPRLELQAALLAARQNARLVEELGIECDTYLWSDSKIVLGYINNDEKRFLTYVANRLSQIHEVSDKPQWHYVNTKCNPADLASRGVFCVDSLVSSMWLRGPDFLWQNDVLPQLRVSGVEQFQVDPDDPELAKESVVHDVCVSRQTQFILSICANCSSWTKAVRVLAIVRKVIRNRHEFLRKQASNLLQSISVDDMKIASLQVICAAQSCSFDEEIACLSVRKLVPSSSSLSRLDCFLDEQGVLRVGGRLRHSKVPDIEKHPAIIPKQSHIATLLVDHYHRAVAHQGRTSTMAAVRTAGFWIVGLSGLVSSHVHRCVTCRRLRRPLEVQKMADLPADRLDAAAPFTYTGCDVFGPFTVKDRRTEVKRYGLLFTCLASRAIHLESLDDLTSDAFINSLRCFISLRGNVKLMRCDNGTNFVGANNEIKRALGRMTSSQTAKKFFLEHNCEFRFNPPHASHFGGAWERMIRSVRNVLSGLRSQVNARLDSSSLRTLLYECMAIINSRPLTALTDELVPLSPNDLLHMKSHVILPIPGDFDSSDVYAKKRWKRVQALADIFWRRWTKEYMTKLQARQKWQTQRRNIQIDDIVIIANECSRLAWALGRVIKTLPGEDGLVRQAYVRTFDPSSRRHTTLLRPVTQLVLLIESV